MRLSRYIKQVLRWIYTYTMRDYAIADVHLLNVLHQGYRDITMITT